MIYLKMHYYLFFVTHLLTTPLLVLSLQCKGENNEDVDWYVLYKIPKLPNSDHNLIKEGTAYLYMDSNTYTSGWTLSKKAIDSNDSIPALTLSPFYDDDKAKNLLWLMYNDQPPNQPARMINGHTKGTVIANENLGFWLIHSVPNFPPHPRTGEEVGKPKSNETLQKLNSNDLPVGEYSYPSSGKMNGQSFLCISTNKDNFNIIGKQLMYNQIIVYRRNVPQNLSSIYNILTEASNQIRIKKAPYNSKINLYSTKGMEFTSFAKSNKWNKDLYDDFVAPQLDTDLYTETWLNGRGKLPSECNQSRVMNIRSIYLSKANIHFKNTHDHSKWAVSTDGKQKAFWVCVGDINRAHTQFDRGGGTVCFNVPEVWKNYKDSVDDIEPCPKPKGFFSKLKSWFGL